MGAAAAESPTENAAHLEIHEPLIDSDWMAAHHDDPGITAR
jgi:hypothetical protein